MRVAVDRFCCTRGQVAIGTSCESSMWPGATQRTELYNVLVEFKHMPYPTRDRIGEAIEVLELRPGDAALHRLPRTIYNTGALLLTELVVRCPFSQGAQLRPATTIKYRDEYYRYDPRVALLTNTLESPANLSSTSLTGHMRTCPLIGPTAPKSFLNEHTCVVSHGCMADDYTGRSFQLNSTTLRQFFLQGNNYVYAIDALPLGTSNADPCKDKVRWRALGACGGRATALDFSTQTVLAAAIRSSPDANLIVKDVELANSDRNMCSNAKGAIVDVDGNCWQHTHNDQLGVYDFTLWTMAHGGNDGAAGFFPIKSVAHDGPDSILRFPSWHPLSRWDKHSGGSWTAIGAPLGRLGDNISFSELPIRVQSAGLAEALGVTVNATQRLGTIEVCGSPGEVQNVPTSENRFYFGKERYKRCCGITQQEMLKNHRQEDNANQKQTIHTSIALYGPDQLRQRVAWALSQIFVIAEFGSEILGDHGEVWMSFYDVFVRHAFASYRDIMREVSFNPIMGSYLTFKNSASFAYKGSHPDENFARESTSCGDYVCTPHADLPDTDCDWPYVLISTSAKHSGPVARSRYATVLAGLVGPT
eukprot:COSAG01_NODE_423_length_17260_cov_203.736962_17_plen_589_part_00